MSPPPAWIRYWACTDDSPTGRHALEYLKALCHVLPVRLIPLEVPVAPRWEPYVARLTSTPMLGAYVNVVCAPRSSWVRQHTVVTPATENRPQETHRGTVELYTTGVRNVLIASPWTAPPAPELDTAKTARKYQMIIAHTNHHAEWRSFASAAPSPGADMPPTVSEGWRTYDELRTLIIG